MTLRLPVSHKEQTTHDCFLFRLPRPTSFEWQPGQACEFALDRDGWRDEARPFTLISDPRGPTLEIIVKVYPDHDGVTVRMRDLEVGDHLLVGSAFGAIRDQGPGVFLAAGTGITPMLALFRARARGEGVGTPGLEGCTLLNGNNTRSDVIRMGELRDMKTLRTVFLLSDENREGFEVGRIDERALERHVPDWSATFYLCGPPAMQEDVRKLLAKRGVDDGRLVVED